jgi:alpha-D-xyloside xylohydrolase
MLPKWSFGYIHCRERFHNQHELLETAKRFRKEGIPLDLIVQDWQYWGKYGWNAMKFDEQNYPDPAGMVRQLHGINMKLMLSVWSKIDTNSDLGKEAAQKGYYIPNTSWIDFFDTEASDFYWKNMSEKLLNPYKIDAWWQDATEPENDDLQGRRIMKGKEIGERYRNIYPNMVSKTVYEGLRKDDPDRRAMIFTRSGYAGIQRYGSVLWSGDVGNDWQTLRYQISAGLGFNASGLPWWTYDAGGFFRPHDQYTNKKYIERMIRWIQVATFLPFMRVHGYMSNTEPWNYGKEAQNIITEYIKLRYRLLPYIYSEAAKVSMNGSTIMRPLVFDFPEDKEALRQDVEYMFGKSLLISPVLTEGVNEWTTYLPICEAGWYDFNSGKKYDGGQNVTTPVTLSNIPVFVKGGTILPYGPEKQWADQHNDSPMEIRIYPGGNADFELYEDEGDNYNYENGEYSIIRFKWNDKSKTLTIDNRQGSYKGMPEERTFIICHDGVNKSIKYQGNRLKIKF